MIVFLIGENQASVDVDEPEFDRREKKPRSAGPLNNVSIVILTPRIDAFTREALLRVLQAVRSDVGAFYGTVRQ